MAKIFISYSRANKEDVRHILQMLESTHDIWWDEFIVAGQDWWKTILDKIEWCEVFIFFISDTSVKSPYCLAELKYAKKRNRLIIPFFLQQPDSVTLPKNLPRRNQWLIYDKNDRIKMLEAINRACNAIDPTVYEDFHARRPPEPNTEGKNLPHMYTEALRAANKLEYDEAREKLLRIRGTNSVEWAEDCNMWLRRINAYEDMADTVIAYQDSNSPTLLKRAKKHWYEYSQSFGKHFDPIGIADILSPTDSNGEDKETENGFKDRVVEPDIVHAELESELPVTHPQNTDRSQPNNETIIPTKSRGILASTPGCSVQVIVYAVIALFVVGASSVLFQDQFNIANPGNNTVVAVISSDEPGLEGTLTRIALNRTADANQATLDAITGARSTDEPTNTPIPPTSTDVPTNTPIPPTPTNTSIPPSPTRVIPTNTLIPVATNTTAPIATDAPISTSFEVQEASFNGVPMVYVPANCFEMGWNDAQANSNEQPVTNTCISNDFWIDRYEVTNEIFERLNGAATNPSLNTGANHPRTNVTWVQANDFCERRGGRLPTESEWEYAASGSENNLYPWGNDPINENTVFDDTADGVQSVGSTGSTSWVGAFDMGGNVAEWTMTMRGYRQDPSLGGDLDYDDSNEAQFNYPYTPSDGRNAEPPSANNLEVFMIVRGGSFDTDILLNTRTSYRENHDIYFNTSTIGFRCIRRAN